MIKAILISSTLFISGVVLTYLSFLFFVGLQDLADFIFGNND